jgi:hypothetical protein
MSVQTTAQPAASRVRVGPLPLVIIASVAFAAGLGVASINAPRTASAGAAVGAAPTFDAVQFHAGERAPLVVAPTFDAVQFRAEERGD